MKVFKLTPEEVHSKQLLVNKTWSKKRKTITCQPIPGLSKNL